MGTLSYLVLTFFVVFFLGTAFTFYVRDRFYTRQAYVATFFTCLLLVSIVGIQFVPMVHFHKFSSEGPEEHTDYELRMVDEQGNEIALDARAVEPLPTSRLSRLGDHMVTEYSEPEREDTAAYVFEEARSYRAYVESDPTIRADTVEFPRHGVSDRWTSEELAKYDDFAQLRVYKVQKVLTEDGTGIETQSSELVYEWDSDGSARVDET